MKNWFGSGAAANVVSLILRLVYNFVIPLFGLALLTFLIGRLMPTDPVLAIVGDQASTETYRHVREGLGLDLPVLEQFWLYLTRLAHGELGRSVLTTRPVVEDILRAFPATLELSIASIMIGIVGGVPLGVLAAVRKDRFSDHAIRVFTLVGYSVPSFWLGLMGLAILYGKLGWAAGPGRLDVAYEYLVEPITGMTTVDALLEQQWDVFYDALQHLVLPSLVIGYFSLALICRMTRALMLSEMNQEYVITAKVKGLSANRIVWRHVFRNTMGSLSTVIALTFGLLLEGSVLTETVFSWPGLGSYMTNSLRNADMNAILGGTLFIGAMFIVVNWIADLIQASLDPRVG
jgi:peptide/nickel transport system permease protein